MKRYAIAAITFIIGFSLAAISQAQPSSNEISDKTARALTAALLDEYKARNFYNEVIDEFGKVKPFHRIAKAEQKHINLLKPLFSKYGVPLPSVSDAERMRVPDTTVKACDVALQAENENKAMYEKYLGTVKEDDIRKAFRYLQNASEKKHARAFERCIDRGDKGRGNKDGKGKGHGKGKDHGKNKDKGKGNGRGR